jgi:hypothetical protein
MPVGVEHDVGGLHISEDHRLRQDVMQVVQDVAQLQGPTDHLGFGYKALVLIENGLQIFTNDELKDQIRALFVREIIIDARDGGVIEGSQNIGFAFEVVDDCIVDGLVTGEVDHLFDCDAFENIREMKVPGRVHCAHASNTDNALDQVAVDQGYTWL